MRHALSFLAVLCGLLAGPAAAGQPRPDHEVVSDVTRAVSLCSNYTIFDDVAAAVDGGVARLTGRVTVPATAEAITRRVSRVPGVRRVDARIAVLPASPADDALRFRIARAIYGNPNFWSYAAMATPPIHIVVERGHVTLTGTVSSDADRLLARSLASSFGAASVRDELRTADETRVSREP